MQVQFIETKPYRSKKEKKMNTYRKNAVMTGILYFMGTVFGVLCYVVGGEVLSSISTGNILGLVAANSSRLSGVAFFNS
jgi:VIT1/CCC1 family predicted Fe2+/Mn2+ transporter